MLVQCYRTLETQTCEILSIIQQLGDLSTSLSMQCWYRVKTSAQSL